MTRRPCLLGLCRLLGLVLLSACGGTPTPQLAPAWQREMETLRAQHFLDGELDAAGQRRLATLLDFEANEPAQADAVDATRGEPEALRGIAWRAWVLRRPDAARLVAEAALAEPGAPATAALVGLVALEPESIAPDALTRLVDRLPDLHPDAALRLRLALREQAWRRGDETALEGLRGPLGSPPVWRRSPPLEAVPARALSATLDLDRTGRLAEGDDLASASGALSLLHLPPSGGVGWLQTACRTDASWTGDVYATSDVGFTVHIDAAPVLRHDPAAGHTGELAVAEVALQPGWHRILAKVAHDNVGRRFALGLTRPDGQPACAEWAAEIPAGATPAGVAVRPRESALAALLVQLAQDPAAIRWAWVLAVTPPRLDRARGVVLAERWVASWPRHADGAYALGVSTLSDPDLPPGLRTARAAAAWRRALAAREAHVPALLALAGAELAGERGREARALVERARRAAPGDPWGALVAFDALLDAGFVHEAAEALAEATDRGAPTGLGRRRLALAEAQGDLAGVEAATREAALEQGRGLHGARAQVCRRRGELACALEALEAAVESMPEEVALHAERLEVARALDDRAAVERAAASLVERAARHTAARFDYGAWLLAHGDEAAARAAWGALVRDGTLGDHRPHAALARLEGVDLSAIDAVDGADVLAEYRDWVPPADVAAAFERSDRVELLDQWIAIVQPDGGVRHLTHRVTQVRSRDAATDVGELALPPGAELLELRTLRADGARVESEGDHGKGETSFSRLGVGDAVDYRYQTYDPPVLGDRGTALGFIFRMPDAPVFRSELTLLVPADLDVKLEPQNGAPAPAVSDWRGYRVYRYRARGLAPLPAEPYGVPLMEVTPRVAIRQGVDLPEIARRVVTRTTGDLRPGRLVRRWVEQARDRTGGDRAALLRALYRRVRRDVAPSNPRRLDGSAETTLAAGRGNRALVLRALLAEAGFDVELLLAHRRDDAQAMNPEHELGYFDWPVLRVALPQGDRWLDPGPAHAPFAWMDPALLGTDALAVEREPPEVVRLPAQADEEATWAFDLDLTGDEDGTLRGTLLLEARGPDTARLREALPQLIPARRLAALEQLIGRSLPGVRVERADWPARPDADEPVRLEMSVVLPTAAASDGTRRIADFLATPLAAILGEVRRPADYAVLAARETPLLIGAHREQLRVRLRVPTGWRIFPAWASFDLTGPAGRVRQTVRNDATTLTLERDTALSITRVAPAAYADFLRWAGAATEATDRPLVLIPPGAGPRAEGADGQDLRGLSLLPGDRRAR